MQLLFHLFVTLERKSCVIMYNLIYETLYPYYHSDLEFLNMFPENLEALYELQIAVQEFTDTYVYIKGYNKCTVERIQHMYMNTYRVSPILLYYSM